MSIANINAYTLRISKDLWASRLEVFVNQGEDRAPKKLTIQRIHEHRNLHPLALSLMLREMADEVEIQAL